MHLPKIHCLLEADTDKTAVSAAADNTVDTAAEVMDIHRMDRSDLA